MNNIMMKFLDSWSKSDGNVNSTKDLLCWIQELNENTQVKIYETSISDDSFWFYDDRRGEILNRKRSFFSIVGIRYFLNDEFMMEQPIILQPEIGYLGIIVKEIDGVLNFLMQAKIEPGNVNCVQISPTIQATKSNFTRAHGGRLPYYFDYFEKGNQVGKIIYDQIQSEQGSRFYGKRNRNIILLVEEDIVLYPNYKWMTLGQIKELMKIDNLVNMDTRTVISGIPFVTFIHSQKELEKSRKYFRDEALFQSIFYTDVEESLNSIEPALNDWKMFHDVEKIVIPLNQLVDWKVNEYGVTCKKRADFIVRYYDIEIDGREVKQWMQPLFKAESEALFVLLTCVEDGKRKFLISLQPEIGCFDGVEFGPSIQIANLNSHISGDEVYRIFSIYDKKKVGILKDVILSEEGGRFYHERNRNVIMEIPVNESRKLTGKGYFWVDYSVLNFLVQTNNNLNIQLRNLMSLLDI